MTNVWRRLGDTARHVPPSDDDLLVLAVVLVAIGAAFLGSVW